MGDFVTRNKPDWDELEKLVARAQSSVHKLEPEEINRLDVLYRRVAIHLAQVRTRTRDERLAVYLNGLAAAAHSVIYLPPRKSVFRKIGAFAAYGFARTIAQIGGTTWFRPRCSLPGGSWPTMPVATTCSPRTRSCRRVIRVSPVRLPNN